MKNTIPLISLVLCFTSIAQAATGSVALGNLQFTNATASHSDSDKNTPASQTIDGIDAEVVVNGWSIGSRTVSDTITWSWQAQSAPILSQGESVSHYTYTINLSCGLTLNNNFLLRSFRLALGDPANTNTFSTVTDYQSLSNTQGAKGHTLFVDANGLINTTQPNPSSDPSNTIWLDTYTLVFNSSTLTNQLRLITTAGQAGWVGGNFLLREITGDVTATVVPEPSTYALILGLFALLYRLTRKGNKTLT